MAEAAAMMKGRKGESWRPEPSSSDGACGRFMHRFVLPGRGQMEKEHSCQALALLSVQGYTFCQLDRFRCICTFYSKQQPHFFCQRKKRTSYLE
jgi:hypothetical protein